MSKILAQYMAMVAGTLAMEDEFETHRRRGMTGVAFVPAPRPGPPQEPGKGLRRHKRAKRKIRMARKKRRGWA